MKQLTVDEMKAIQLEILDVVMKFCDEHEIKCWLDGGTLIGTIRHKGYIPWDDDIDLGMLRPDYEKFMKLFNKENTRYKFVCYELDENFYQAFGKVLDTQTVLYEPDEKGTKLAVYVDIFTYDNVPDEKEIIDDMFRKRNKYYICNVARQARIFQRPKGNFLRRLCVYALRSVVRIFPKNYFVRKIIMNSKRYVNAETRLIGNFLGVARMTCDKRVFNSLIDGEFEGKTYKIPVGYDEYLREFYGDYMQLPPEEKRVSTHIFKAFKKDD